MWICKKCNEEVDDEYDVCWNCGSDKKGSTAINIKKNREKQFQSSEIVIDDPAPIVEQEVLLADKPRPKTKYPALRTLSDLFVVFAVILGIVAVVSGIYACTLGEMGIVVGIISIAFGALTVLLLVAAGELIKLFVDIEKNTRQSKRK